MSPDTNFVHDMDSEHQHRRLDVVHRDNIIDTTPHPALDALTRSAAKIFGVPISLITLIGADRQYLKSYQGDDYPELSREDAFSRNLPESRFQVVVPDAHKDPVLMKSPYVTGNPHIRFYAGVPLVNSDDEVLGSFCILDTEPRARLQDHELAVLDALAAQAVEIISTEHPVNQTVVPEQSSADTGLTFHSFVRDVPMPVAVLDRDFRYVAVSDDWYHAFQIEKDNIIGMSFTDNFPAINETRAALFRHVLNTGESETGQDVQYETADGTSIWMRCDTKPWYSADGTIGGLVLYRQVIEDEVQTRFEAARTQRLFETFFYHNPAHLYVKSLDGEYQIYNKAFATGFDLELNQEGLRASDILPEDAVLAMEALDKQALETGRVAQGQVDVIVEDDLKYRLDVRKFPVTNDDGEIWAIGGVTIDATENFNTERAMRQVQKMEAVGNLTGGIAHDFNNILAVVLGNLQLLERHIPNDSKEADRLNGAKNATLRGAGLTKQLLAFSRRQELEPKVIDVNATIKDLNKMISRTLSETIDIQLKLPSDLPHAFIDEGQFQNCVLNLSINARDAMPDGGTLQIETKYLEVADDALAGLDGLKSGEYVAVSITDTGHGMTKEVKERVFEPFFTTKGVGSGTGLGLAMVYGFIKQSKGHVSVYSEPNIGTTVRLFLPVSQEAMMNDEAPEIEVMEEAAGRILVVEDDEDVGAIVEAMLEDIGYETTITTTGPEAVKTLVSGADFDLVFSDVIMPGGMTGVDLARVISQRWPEVPVLLTSGYPRDAVKTDETVHILQKPYQQHELAAEIANAINVQKGTES